MAALEQVQLGVPDLVIADVHMPRLDGGQLARRLREWNVPVILLTADPNWSRTPGVVYVAKPFDLDHLLAIVADLLDGQAQDDGGG
jgi:DNA-binding response OmpR family regulator